MFGCESEKATDEGIALLCEKTFGVELYAFYWGVSEDAMFGTEGHDFIFIGPSGNFKIFMIKCIWFDYQAVVTRGGEGVGHILKDGFAIMMHGACLAMHEAVVGANGHAKRLCDRLVSEADTEDWDFACECFDDVTADACFVGSARSWGDNDVVGVEGFGLLNRDFIVSEYLQV